jgi:tetratricopeptide (TPR) repeat protein
MSIAAFERGHILFGQKRFDLAAAEFRRVLSEDPDHPFAHALLALCLGRTGQREESLREADEAVRLAPDNPFCHFVRGHGLLEADRTREAEEAARTAIELDPGDADFRDLLARIEIHRRQWARALEAADAGLALDPTHDSCLNLRAMALVQLGRKDEAVQTLGSSLADDPENALTHANQGWAYLHQSEPDKALEHFREALRLDPELEWARVGIIEALKARHRVYRVMLAFFLWMGRKSQAAQWAILLGFVFGRMLLRGLARSYPALAPFVIPILVLTFAFMLMSWIASPLFNLVLRFNRFGRMALSREETVASTWIGGCFIVAAAAAVLSFTAGWDLAWFSMIFFGLMLLPLAMTFNQAAGKPRRLAAAYTAVVALMALPLLSLLVLGAASPFAKQPGRAFEYFNYFIWGAVISSWASNLLSSRLST